MSDVADVLVAGAGPSGLLLAGILAGGGARVTVLESRQVPNPQTRASTLHARAMEILAAHGVGFGRELPRATHGHYAGIPVDLSQVDSKWAGVWRCPQPELVRTLTGWARQRGVRVHYGERVSSLRGQGRRCIAETADGAFAASLVVAADGQASTLRSLLGIECEGARPARVLVQADLLNAEVPGRRFERRGRYTVTAAPLSAEVTRVMIHDPLWTIGEVRTPEDLRSAWRDATGDELPVEPSWLRTFGDDTRVAGRLVADRVVLCGDAAHPFIPIGGQALNTSIMDAEALGRRVLDHLAGADRALLDYQDERLVQLRSVAQRLRAQARLLFDTDEATARDKSRIAGKLATDETYRRRIAGGIAGFDVLEREVAR